jgi:hypothetical protein
VSVELNRTGETGVYTEVNEDFEYRSNSNHAGAVGFERGLINVPVLKRLTKAD